MPSLNKKLPPDEEGKPGLNPIPCCGIVMPISSTDGCPESHWLEVKDILTSAIESANFTCKLVSDSDDAGVIHRNIIENLYHNDMIVCDVSGKNSNVMFELGMRLAFDKPIIIIKDDATDYSFDTSPIEHIVYPRDLRFSLINNFKDALQVKIAATHRAAKDNNNYTTFLKHFGTFSVAKLDNTELDRDDYIIAKLDHLSAKMNRINHGPISKHRDRSDAAAESLVDIILQTILERPDNKQHLEELASDHKMLSERILDDKSIMSMFPVAKIFPHRAMYEQAIKGAVSRRNERTRDEILMQRLTQNHLDSIIEDEIEEDLSFIE